MTCKLNGLFSIGEDFDDEDLLEAEWAAPSSSVPAGVSAPVSSSALRLPRRDRDAASSHRTGETSEASDEDAGSTGHAQTATPTDAIGSRLRQISSSVPPPSLSTVSHACPIMAPHPMPPTGEGCQKASQVQDEFEDWDVDLADLDESDPQQVGTGVQNAPAASPAGSTGDLISSANRLRPSNCGRTQPVAGATQLSHRATGGLSRSILPSPRKPASCVTPATPGPRPSLAPAPPRSPAVFPVPGPSPRPLRGSHPPPQGPWTTPGPPPRGRSLFEPVSPASPAAYSPRPLSAPVLTNHLVQLVSAANNPPRKRPRSGARQPNTRRFPGPAGLLPQQPLNQSLDDIVVSVPQTPAHGAVARLPSQCSSSQSEEEEFSSGPWGAMKADMGLDERNPTCFLHSYSVVMVLRKAALRQLAQNKVPNMAVQLKSILHTHADAKAVFRDPTGEIQGTVHRRLLEDRLGELKAGAVLLLKQVGVFSPSHRNHYLNVTPSNLLRIYPPDGVCTSSSTPYLPPLVLEPACPSTSRPPSAPGGPVSSMQLELEEEEEEEEDESRQEFALGTSSEALPGTKHKKAPQDPSWDGDDDLNELLGDLLEGSYSL
ncbi:unnamed protein product [Merluccius merluccius]